MENFTTQILENGNLLITIPISLRSQRGRKRIISPDTSPDHTNDSILRAMARGRRPTSLRYAVTSWHPPSHFVLRRIFEKLIDDNQFTNIKELADTILLRRSNAKTGGKDPSQIARAIGKVTTA